jgi:hypothetical protein
MKTQITIPWLIIAVLALGFILFITLFDGCGGEQSTKDLVIENKVLQNKNDSTLKVITRLEQNNLALQENQIVIEKEVTAAKNENRILKSKLQKSTGTWIELVSKEPLTQKDSACVAALNDCSNLVGGLEAEISVKDSLEKNKTSQIAGLSEMNKGLYLILVNDSAIKANLEKQVSILKKQNRNFKVFAGIFGQYMSKTNIPECGIAADFQIKNALIGVQYGILQNSVSVSAKYKLSFRRNK